MVEEPLEEPGGDMPARVCATCGHAEGDHVEQNAEIPGGTMRRIYCGPCRAFHDFVPSPQDE